MNLAETIEEMQQAIALEIRASATDYSRNMEVSKAKLIAEAEEGFLYCFSAEVQVPVQPETPVIFKTPGFNRVQGIWIGQDEFEVLLLLRERLDPSVKRGRLVIDLSFILEALSVKLGEVKSSPGIELVQNLTAGRIADRCWVACHIDDSIQSLRAAGQRINSSQEAAIRNSVKQGIHFVWGPPGTGKTANLAHLCRVLCEENEKIIIVAHAHAAVDVAMLRVAEAMDGSELLAKGKVLRIGVSQNREVRHHKYLTVLGILRQSEPDLLYRWEHLEEQKRKLQAEIREVAKSMLGLLERSLSAVRQELEALRARIREVESALIGNASIIGCTAAKSVIDERIWNREVDTVIIDEASMMNYPFVTALVSRATKRAVQFGDFRQLPPIVVSEEELAVKWLGEDSFHISGVTKSVEAGVDDARITMLEEQYRMHSKICNVVSLLSYDERLVTADGVDSRVSQIAELSPHPGEALVLADTSDFRSVCLKECMPGRFSRVNPIHAVIAINLAHNLLRSETGVCIITPYRAQAQLIFTLAKVLKVDVPVATVHRFQGGERSTVIFDVCDAFPQQRASRLTGHNPDIALRLVNVGISRAQGKLILLADREFVFNYHDGLSPTRKLCAYIKQFGAARPLELDDLDSDEAAFEWFDDFGSAQPTLARELSSCRKAWLNLPEGFHPSSQVLRALEKNPETDVFVQAPLQTARGLSDKGVSTQTLVSAGGFCALFSSGAFVGGRDASAPVVFVRGDVADAFGKAFCVREQEDGARSFSHQSATGYGKTHS